MKCQICGTEKFIAHQLFRADVFVNGNGNFDENIGDNLESHIYDAENPYGPFTCACCGAEYAELDGTAPIARSALTEIESNVGGTEVIPGGRFVFAVDRLWLTVQIRDRTIDTLSGIERWNLFLEASAQGKIVYFRNKENTPEENNTPNCYSTTIAIPKDTAKAIRGYTHPRNAEGYQREDNIISYTVCFSDGKQADVQCCGIRDQCPWCEMVLYDENGHKLACTEPGDDFFGEWELKDNGISYIVTVKEAEK